jgi:hypothetical protein
MAPLCKVDVTLPGVRRASGVRDAGGVDEQEGVRLREGPSVQRLTCCISYVRKETRAVARRSEQGKWFRRPSGAVAAAPGGIAPRSAQHAIPSALTVIQLASVSSPGKGRQPWPLRDVPDGRGRRVAAHVQGHPDAYCPASGAARISLRAARIECDKQRRQECAMMKAKQQSLCDEAGTHRFRRPWHPSPLGLLPWTQKTDNGARLSRNARKTFS